MDLSTYITPGKQSGSFAHRGATPLLSSVTESGSVRAVGYDAAGNETVTGASTFTYSPRNHLLEDGVYEYGYDGRGVRTVATRTGVPIGQGSPAAGAEGMDGEMVRQPSVLCASLGLESCLAVPAFTVRPLNTTPGYYKLYTSELTLLAETVTSTGAIKPIAYEYIWFGGQPVAQVDVATGAIDWIFTDHLGTPILQTDANANVTWRVEYEPYGEVFEVRAGAGKHQPLRFPGQEFDANTPERAYNIFRWYRAGWGRYTQADPLQSGNMVARPGDPRASHTFGYGNMNPSSFTDPLGLAPCKGECADCPSGYWAYVDRSWAYGAIWAKQKGQITFVCVGKSSKRCSFSYECKTVGLQALVWGAVDTGLIGGPECGCANSLTESFVKGNTFSVAGGAFWDKTKCTGGGFDASGGFGGSFVSKPYGCSVSQVSCTN